MPIVKIFYCPKLSEKAMADYAEKVQHLILTLLPAHYSNLTVQTAFIKTEFLRYGHNYYIEIEMRKEPDITDKIAQKIVTEVDKLFDGMSEPIKAHLAFYADKHVFGMH